MQSLFDIRHHYVETLSEIYPKDEAMALFQIATEEILGYKRTQLSLLLQTTVDKEAQDRLLEILTQLKNHRPIQYILGKAPFYGMDLLVNEYTLIPRPETEELVSMVIHNHNQQAGLRIMDIGTGSGCIAIALAKNMKSPRVTAIDISEKAIAMAQQNCATQAVDIQVLQLDITQWSSTFDPTDRYDVIISNPPYIKEHEKQAMSPNVLDYEPHTALFVSDSDPLVFYDHIAALAIKHLVSDGSLYFEINQYLPAETVSLIQNKGFSKVSLINDINNAPRMIWAKK